MAKTILVTGGAGYIGSHTVIELVASGYLPVILDNCANSSADIVPVLEEITGVSIPFVLGDCRDEKLLESIFNTYTIDAVIHFAADKAVGESVQNPLKYFDNNLNGLVTLLKVMDARAMRNIVFSSSCTVYGTPDTPSVDEESPLKRAESPYGFTKYAGEEILRYLVENKHPYRAALLRYFNPIGAHPSGKIGEAPQGTPNNLLPYLTQTAKGLRDKLAVFGNDYDTVDGTCVRDFIHVCDLAQAHVNALDFLADQTPPFLEAVNIGTGKGTSVHEIIRMFEQQTGIALNWAFAPRRAGDVPEIYAKAEKATQLLNWNPRYTVDDAIAHAWKWEQNRKDT
jgi:UDP-glucose 4-epimerase